MLEKCSLELAKLELVHTKNMKIIINRVTLVLL